MRRHQRRLESHSQRSTDAPGSKLGLRELKTWPLCRTLGPVVWVLTEVWGRAADPEQPSRKSTPAFETLLFFPVEHVIHVHEILMVSLGHVGEKL